MNFNKERIQSKRKLETMKKLILSAALLFSLATYGQNLKNDGKPDVRYKENKETVAPIKQEVMTVKSMTGINSDIKEEEFSVCIENPPISYKNNLEYYWLNEIGVGKVINGKNIIDLLRKS